MSLKKENFIRIAENRTNKILKMLELLGNLSNTSYYEYTDEEIKKIFKVIETSLGIQKDRFKSVSHKQKDFTLR